MQPIVAGKAVDLRHAVKTCDHFFRMDATAPGRVAEHQPEGSVPPNGEPNTLRGSQGTASGTSWPDVLPAHLPGERIVYPAPSVCRVTAIAIARDRRGVTETLAVIPPQWKVSQDIREKSSCRTCEAISDQPAAGIFAATRARARRRHPVPMR